MLTGTSLALHLPSSVSTSSAQLRKIISATDLQYSSPLCVVVQIDKPKQVHELQTQDA